MIVSTTTSPAHNSSSARPMRRSTAPASVAPPDAGAASLRSMLTDMLCLDRRDEFVELAVIALCVFEERRVAAVVVQGNAGALDRGGGHFIGGRKDQRIV